MRHVVWLHMACIQAEQSEVIVFLQHYTEVQYSPILNIHACTIAYLIPQMGQYETCQLGYTVAQQPVI